MTADDLIARLVDTVTPAAQDAITDLLLRQGHSPTADEVEAILDQVIRIIVLKAMSGTPTT